MSEGARKAPGPGLFRDILLAPDREWIPGARPVVSYDPGDEDAFLTEIRDRARSRFPVERRGVALGHWAELEPAGLAPKPPRRRRRAVVELERWGAARPLFFPGAAREALEAARSDDPLALHARLGEAGGLRAWLAAWAPRLAPAFVPDAPLPRADPERDLERVGVHAADGSRLWVKSGRLSLHEGDRSLRLRVAFGTEGDDDASAEEHLHGRVAELASLLLPGAEAFARASALLGRLSELADAPLYGTQHIAYWNAPGGGARFHHDAFAASEGEAEGAPGQRGVAFAQLAGRTAWLALSIEDLAARVRELAAWVEEGALPWLRDALGDEASEVLGLCRRRSACLRELALPGCGRLGALVDGPEATAALADAGHALVLAPGDVLVLPNHGLARTAMHSVFCAGPEVGYGLSVALRARPAGEASR